MANSSAAIVYAEQLVGRGYGLPLWHPEPLGPLGEVEIGDVGYISEGAFIRLFNALRPAEDPLNADGVPEGFVVLQPNIQLLRSNEEHVSPGPICTTTTTFRKVGAEAEGGSTAGASYTFSCNSSRGAIAVLGDTGHQQWYLRNRSFREYTAKHHASWHAFAIARDHDVSLESLVLISGWLKTSEWALATFANQGKAHELALSAAAGTFAHASFEVAAGTAVQLSVEQRAGPPKPRGDAPPVAGPLPHNQCLFVRYYKLRSRAFGRPRVTLQANARDVQGPWQDDDAGRRHNRGSTSGSAGDASDTGARSWLARFFGESHVLSRPNPWRQTSATGKSSTKSGYSSSRSGLSQVEEVPRADVRRSAHDPVEAVLDYILEYSSARIAVACHEDAYDFFSSDQSLVATTGCDPWPQDLGQNLARRVPEIVVGEDGVGCLKAQSRHNKTLAQVFGSEDLIDGLMQQVPQAGNLPTEPAQNYTQAAPRPISTAPGLKCYTDEYAPKPDSSDAPAAALTPELPSGILGKLRNLTPWRAPDHRARLIPATSLQREASGVHVRADSDRTLVE